ncbi:MAG: YhcH/YjgK/YiaL family protein [Alistipes sp.]|nr:YhcH/YjgK/YiaL family protein [Alistipes sp.]MDE6507473.1 YhcH/YjgK/YiaL family protein [Alistipes sp.]MDE7078271.1 YhcH/YjgK/YiaL family protein [Alistipes sp.]MDE7344790.1 YhcH/YjgK/YiaL family protein [Alistipes sp.]
MIFDSLKNRALYENVHPRMKRAFEVLADTDWTRTEPGIHEIEGRDIYVNVMERELKKKGDAKLEVHNEYIDIQLLVSGEAETFGWSDRRNLCRAQGEFNPEKDIQFFEDEPQTYYTMRPGQFSVLFPEDGHAPMVGEGVVRKVIAKVRL